MKKPIKKKKVIKEMNEETETITIYFSCDECKARTTAPFADPWIMIKYICDNYGWSFGGCNTELLCNKCTKKGERDGRIKEMAVE